MVVNACKLVIYGYIARCGWIAVPHPLPVLEPGWTFVVVAVVLPISCVIVVDLPTGVEFG